ncbi:hypothetical protein M0R72_15975 [Candidatus Pacearchaeota archaeon]|jgi:hypothetical protein|nr:hypothetical protein [Candidatus Pacearchaeota archaeon]
MSKFVIPEDGHIAIGLYPVALSTGATCDAVNMENYSHLDALVVCGASQGGPTTITVLAATDGSATSAEAIAFDYYAEETASTDILGARTAATTAGVAMDNDATSSIFYVVSIDASQLPADHKFVNVTLAGSASTTPAAVIYILSGARYGGPESPTALS